ncbi:hypothetical protein IGS75_01385 [Gluconobacter sphaericus]|uniref:hypothetical protein n=1 Tax=Gluconobacter sphaericus TaxID=574987 RepID=UPI001920918B|nr:hypothetical protein [Gluconobacter sphaericus]QQX91323.1 hypothetical protein IGS75_01385 [Gluconobacter sphaericus]
MINPENPPISNTWPACIGEHAAALANYHRLGMVRDSLDIGGRAHSEENGLLGLVVPFDVHLAALDHWPREAIKSRLARSASVINPWAEVRRLGYWLIPHIVNTTYRKFIG